jgi:hypothetical protein
MTDIYHCYLDSDPKIESLYSSYINSSIGYHKYGKTNNDVTGFESYRRTIRYFPHGLEKIFGNLKLISIWYGRILGINKSDLKPFTELVYLSLYENDIKILESGLFDFNPKLEVISLSNNKIYNIGEFVFNNLANLSYLGLEWNTCINYENRYTDIDIKYVIKHAKDYCHYNNTMKMGNLGRVVKDRI